MPWTTATAVRSIINQPPVPAGADVQPFIDTAEAVINERVVPAGLYSDGYIAIMAMWLAAHFYAVDRRRKKTLQAMDDAQDQYETTLPGDGFKDTEYGKQVIAMDWKNLLGRKLPVVTKWLGKPWQ